MNKGGKRKCAAKAKGDELNLKKARIPAETLPQPPEIPQEVIVPDRKEESISPTTMSLGKSQHGITLTVMFSTMISSAIIVF